MEGGVTSYLFTQGVLGVACIVLGLVIVKLYNKTERLQIKNDELQKEKEAIIDARRIEAKETAKEVIDVLQGNSQNMRILSEKIEIGKRRSE